MTTADILNVLLIAEREGHIKAYLTALKQKHMHYPAAQDALRIWEESKQVTQWIQDTMPYSE